MLIKCLLREGNGKCEAERKREEEKEKEDRTSAVGRRASAEGERGGEGEEEEIKVEIVFSFNKLLLSHHPHVLAYHPPSKPVVTTPSHTYIGEAIVFLKLLLFGSKVAKYQSDFYQWWIASPPGNIQSVIFINYSDVTAGDILPPDFILVLIMLNFDNFVIKPN